VVQIKDADDLTLKDCVAVSSLAAADVRLYGSTMANKASTRT